MRNGPARVAARTGPPIDRIDAHRSLWGSSRSEIAIGTSPGPVWLKEPWVRIQGRVDEDGQAYHDLRRDRYRQTYTRRGDRRQLGAAAGREHARGLQGAVGLAAAASGEACRHRG